MGRSPVLAICFRPITIAHSFGPGTNVPISIDNYASDSDVCLVFLNANSGEGTGRTELRNHDQDLLVQKVAASCSNTIVVVITVGPRILEAWVNNENVTAIVYGGLLGQNSGYSITDILYGAVNPFGRLAYTIAKAEDDYSAKICNTAECTFGEENYIDYKHFGKSNITPRYEFGYGLSYTAFGYSGLKVTPQRERLSSKYASAQLSVGGREDLWDNVATVNATVTNIGDRPGHEVAQLYLSFPEEADQPVHQLRGFERVLCSPGESVGVGFQLRRRDFSYWDIYQQEWAIAAGSYNISVEPSSR